MKRFLLILMTLASVAMANDAKMKALLVGTWTNNYDQITNVFRADGTWLMGDTEPYEKWDIEDGRNYIFFKRD
jgi:hypothetical protein